MSVEGLRAWIGEVERKLAKRTRVFLALTVIAIGVAGASLYLAIEARNDSVSEGDVRALQKEIEEGIAKSAITPAPAGEGESVEAEPPPPTAQPEESKPKSKGGSAPKSSSGGAQDKSARILELLERTKKQNAELEAKQKQEAAK